eukprot:g53987.t1
MENHFAYKKQDKSKGAALANTSIIEAGPSGCFETSSVSLVVRCRRRTMATKETDSLKQGLAKSSSKGEHMEDYLTVLEDEDDAGRAQRGIPPLKARCSRACSEGKARCSRACSEGVTLCRNACFQANPKNLSRTGLISIVAIFLALIAIILTIVLATRPNDPKHDLERSLPSILTDGFLDDWVVDKEGKLHHHTKETKKGKHTKKTKKGKHHKHPTSAPTGDSGGGGGEESGELSTSVTPSVSPSVSPSPSASPDPCTGSGLSYPGDGPACCDILVTLAPCFVGFQGLMVNSVTDACDMAMMTSVEVVCDNLNLGTAAIAVPETTPTFSPASLFASTGDVVFPALQKVLGSFIVYESALTSISAPKLTIIGESLNLESNPSLTSATFPNVESTGSAFTNGARRRHLQRVRTGAYKKDVKAVATPLSAGLIVIANGVLNELLVPKLALIAGIFQVQSNAANIGSTIATCVLASNILAATSCEVPIQAGCSTTCNIPAPSDPFSARRKASAENRLPRKGFDSEAQIYYLWQWNTVTDSNEVKPSLVQL